MSEINYKPIFDYIDETKKDILEQVATKADILDLKTQVTNLASRFDNVEKKENVTEAKAEKLEHWAIQVAEQTKIPYKP